MKNVTLLVFHVRLNNISLVKSDKQTLINTIQLLITVNFVILFSKKLFQSNNF